MATLDGKRDGKKICSVCNGNGFVKIPYEQAREEQWADCEFCNNQGETDADTRRPRTERPDKTN